MFPSEQRRSALRRRPDRYIILEDPKVESDDGGFQLRAKSAAGLGLLLILALAGIACAATESYSLGPFVLSFDLNSTIPYTVSTERPLDAAGGSLIYGLSIRSNDGLIYIAITYNPDLRPATFEANRAIVQSFLQEMGCTDLNITREIIDAHQAAIGGGLLPSGRVLYCASYSPDGTTEEGALEGRTNCRLLSTFPLAETANLLRSIHVEPPKSA